jgi:hypothetical protein
MESYGDDDRLTTQWSIQFKEAEINPVCAATVAKIGRGESTPWPP